MDRLASLVERSLVRQDVLLGPMTTYKTGGPARFFADINDLEELTALVETRVTTELSVLVLGRGSNLLISDEGFDGLVIRLGEGFNKVQVTGTEVLAGSAVPLPRLARTSVEKGLRGLEFFVGVPGSVGGAVRQNAGCFGTETRDRLVEAELVDLSTGVFKTANPDDLELSYRHSNLRPTDLVISARLAGRRGDREAGIQEIRKITRWRRDNQPGGTLNAGSVFKNPSGISAGELIDRLGLKGLRVGDVSVSDKHANFFVAGPNASSSDVYALIRKVKDRVLELSGTILETEVQCVGFER